MKNFITITLFLIPLTVETSGFIMCTLWFHLLVTRKLKPKGDVTILMSGKTPKQNDLLNPIHNDRRSSPLPYVKVRR